MNSSNNSATFVPVYPVYDGTGWIQASIGGILVRHDVWVGKPVITAIYGDTYPKGSSGENYEYIAYYDDKADIPQSTGFQWVLNPSGPTYNATSGSLRISFNGTGYRQLLVRATNANGTGEYCSLTLNVSSPSSYSTLYQVYPNPVSDELTVNLRSQLSSVPLQSSAGSQTVGSNAYTVYLYNANGASVRQVISQGGDQVQLDVSSLPNGIYYLMIDIGDGNKPEVHKIIVKH